MEIMRKIVKVTLVPIMLIVKLLVALFGFAVIAAIAVLGLFSGIIGEIIKRLAGIAISLSVIVGFVMMGVIYGYHDMIFNSIVATLTFGIIGSLPYLADFLLEKCAEFGGFVAGKAIHDIPVVLDI